MYVRKLKGSGFGILPITDINQLSVEGSRGLGPSAIRSRFLQQPRSHCSGPIQPHYISPTIHLVFRYCAPPGCLELPIPSKVKKAEEEFD